ncbi:potassium transporter TrkG [Ahrensia sp. R2A130]|uniref:potassium transporter TrkG n=1 Tax=Ahrensia sp. R2A130 TaxID=744979 RepID=UPI0001E0B460|nr:potassium transporter TrkG [Ahrensia sp. R2A130]EFL90141.1 putative Trk system potassium uptake protein TrkH [Ahrensia sp. R2A130]
MLAVAFYLACTGLIVTVSLLAPVAIAILAGEGDVARRLGFYILMGSFVFGGPALAIIGRLGRLPQIGRLLLLALVWTVLPISLAVPIWDLTQISFVDALFEAVSGLTTTGSTTVREIEQWPQAMIFLRVQAQWIGGYLALLTVILIIAPSGIGGLQSRDTIMFVGADFRAQQGRLLAFAGNLALFYAILTVVCFLAMFITGTRAFYALTLSMTAISTGGFLPFDSSLDQTVPLGSLFIFGVFLVAGATSIYWQRMLTSGQWARARQHRESYFVLGLIAITTFVFAFSFIDVSGVEGTGGGRILIEAFVNAASLVSTSGLETQPGYMTLLPLVTVLFIVFAGGSAFSTSGGLKLYRMGGMLVQSLSELDRLIYPHIVRGSHFGSERYDMQLMKAIWSFFVVAIITIAVASILVSAGGVPFEAALTATIASFTTAGPIYNPDWGQASEVPWPEYANFATSAKLVLMMTMLLGRLEVLAVIGIFSLRYWRTR